MEMKILLGIELNTGHVAVWQRTKEHVCTLWLPWDFEAEFKTVELISLFEEILRLNSNQDVMWLFPLADTWLTEPFLVDIGSLNIFQIF